MNLLCCATSVADGDTCNTNVTMTTDVGSVVPSSCDCGGEHNANSWLCEKKPQENRKSRINTKGKSSEPTGHVQNTQPYVWQKRVEQQLTDQASLSQENIIKVQGNVPARQQEFQVNADDAWRREINDKEIDCRYAETNGAVAVESVSAAATDSIVDATAGGSTEGPAVSTVVDVAVGTDAANVMGNSMASKEVNKLMNVLTEVRSLLQLVRTYVDNPKGKLKSKILQCLSSVENKIHRNGG
ncbi:hypothetical protein SK128_020420 [Halocaridina rubra]|uniref:Uncharacterized protein n=1 Tax=Halocaridina rubra TaxID=373956 RepID=A0AAN9FU98_HALRR